MLRFIHYILGRAARPKTQITDSVEHYWNSLYFEYSHFRACTDVRVFLVEYEMHHSPHPGIPPASSFVSM